MFMLNAIKKRWSIRHLIKLDYRYVIYFWILFVFLYFIDYLPWIENGSATYLDVVLLTLVNFIVDPIFAFIHFAIFYKPFLEIPDPLKKIKNLIIYLLILSILGVINSLFYWGIASIFQNYGWMSDSHSVLWYRNIPEATFSMIAFTGIWSFFQKNRRLEVDKMRLSRRGLLHDHENLFSYLSIYNDKNSEEFEEFQDQLSKYATYLINDRVKDKIRLIDEVKHLENYLNLRSIKYKTRIKQIRFEHPFDNGELPNNNSEHYHIVPGILIEGIRNAIKHGLGAAEQGETGGIEVFITEQNGEFHYRVTNTVHKNSKDEMGGSGLKYTNECLNVYYPDRHEFNYGEDRVSENYYFEVKINFNANDKMLDR